MQTNNVKLEIYWDDRYAEYRYQLVKDGVDVLSANGDYEWANKTAAHYGITVPRAGEEHEETV